MSMSGRARPKNRARRYAATVVTALVCSVVLLQSRALASPITIAQNIVASGSIVITTADTMANDNITVLEGRILEAGGDIVIQAGDDVLLLARSRLTAAGTVTIRPDFAKVDDVGASVVIRGTVESPATPTIAAGPGDDTLTIDFPAGASLPNGVSIDGAAGNDTLTIDVGGTVDPFLTITANTAGSLTGSYSFADRPSINFANIENLAPAADLGITKTDGGSETMPGSPITYTIVASNNGSIGENGVTVTDALPAILESASWTCDAAIGSSCGAVSGAGNIDEVVSLAAGGSVTYTMSAIVGATGSTSLSNSATVSPPDGVVDPNPSNNSETDTNALLHAPVAVDDEATTLEDTAVDVVVVANDMDADTPNGELRAVSIANIVGGNATLLADGRTVRFSPSTNANQANTSAFGFTYRVNDGSFDSANEGSVAVTVTPVNDPPTIAALTPQSVRWGNELSFSVQGSDVDLPADTLSYSLLGAPVGATIDASTGTVKWTPTSAQVGVATFTVRVQDDGTPSLSAETPMTISVQRRPTRLQYSGATQGQFSDPTAVVASLTDDGGGALQGTGVGGQAVHFALGTQAATATTNGNGNAAMSIVLDQHPGATQVTTSFAGDALYLPSGDSDPFTITPEDAVVTYTGPTFVVGISPLTGRTTFAVSASVGEAADGFLGGKLVVTEMTFTVRRSSSGVVLATCRATVRSSSPGAGSGSCPVTLRTGSYSVTVAIVGNGYYAAPPAPPRTLTVIAI